MVQLEMIMVQLGHSTGKFPERMEFSNIFQHFHYDKPSISWPSFADFKVLCVGHNNYYQTGPRRGSRQYNP